MKTILPGEIFNSLTFIDNIVFEPRREKRRYGLFLCSCGEIVKLPIGRVAAGYIKSCGAKIHMKGNNKKHGMRNTKEYKTWIGIKGRVQNPGNKDYIKYSKLEHDDDILLDFNRFFSCVGPCPGKEYSIDRINNNIGYKKDNIRWATRSQQQKNKTGSYTIIIRNIEYNSLLEASILEGKSIQTIWRWCHNVFDKRRNKWTPPRDWAKIKLKYTHVNKDQMLG